MKTTYKIYQLEEIMVQDFSRHGVKFIKTIASIEIFASSLNSEFKSKQDAIDCIIEHGNFTEQYEIKEILTLV